MNAIWNETTSVKSYDVGKGGVLKPQVIFQFFQEAAANHATHLGVGYEALQALGLFWALSRVKIEIAALPAWGDDVVVTTWAKGVDRLFALRDFRITGPDGGLMVRGTSGWLLVDIAKMRPRRIDSLPGSFPINDTEHALKEILDKIVVPAFLNPCYERKVMTSDLDINDHVNNTEYIRWVSDCLEGNGVAGTSLHSIQVNYLEGAKLGDILLFSLGKGEDERTLFVEGVNQANQARVVQARVGLKS